MEVPNPVTPRKIYYSSNICVVCGFSFIQTEITATGARIEKKFTNRKLKLNNERLENIKKVISNFQHEHESINGICTKCYGQVERVLKLQNDFMKLQVELNETRNGVRKSYNLTCIKSKSASKEQKHEKRLLQSPLSDQPKKQTRSDFPANISVVSMVAMPSFDQLMAEQAPVTVTEVVKPKSTRRSLPFSSKEPGADSDDSVLVGEVEMTIYYPHGKRTTFVTDVTHRSICRAIYRRQNVEKIIIDTLSKSHPDIVTAATAGIVAKECEAICKRGSGALLQNKSYTGILEFEWSEFHDELQLKAPHTLKVISSSLSSIPLSLGEKKFIQLLQNMANIFHSRSQEMSSVHYQIGLLLSHGGCKQKDIERLAKLGLTVNPRSIQNKLSSWEENLDKEIVEIKQMWENNETGTCSKFQIVGDNWDKNILPSYRTSKDQTLSLHLFQVIAVIDRLIPEVQNDPDQDEIHLQPVDFIPSIEEQKRFRKDLSFLVATSIISHVEKLTKVYERIFPKHLEHEHSDLAGIKTKQFPLGLFDCNENKTQDVIKLLKMLTEKYVPLAPNDDVKDEVFFGGDRLTDERVQSAQQAMANAATPKERLEGFVSKIEDWHRMMNFMEAIYKLTYSQQSQMDRGTACFFRNMLNARNVKGEVKNAFRAYKMLYYTIFDACCCVMIMKHFDVDTLEEIEFPPGFDEMNSNEKVEWLMKICEGIVDQWFFEQRVDALEELREILEDPEHPENYWVLNNDGRFPCHFCEKTYAHSESLRKHEKKMHNKTVPKLEKKKKTAGKNDDELFNYITLLFKLTCLLKNLDTAIDMADGGRAVRSAKYELPIFNKTNKTKYVIGCIHLTALSEETLSPEQRERLVWNRTINIQGGKNNNIALDEYVEMLNRDSKDIVSGHQTKESIIGHSKAYPHLINYAKHFDEISDVRKRKGFHKLPNYKEDVQKVTKELIETSNKCNSETVTKSPKRSFPIDSHVIISDSPMVTNSFY